MNKTCQNCHKNYEQKKGKGSTKAKYCHPCRIIVRKEQMRQGQLRRNIKLHAIPDESQVMFYGYKEPLKKFAGGFGYQGVLTYSKDKDRVQCHICGRLYKNVGSHSKLTHGLTAREYKERTGLAQNTALVGEGTRALLIVAHKEIPSFSQRNKSKVDIRKHMKYMSDKANKKGVKRWSLERRNKEGNCPDQLIDRILKLKDKLGRRPTAKEYAKEYGSFQSIITVYGKWETALKFAGIPLHSTERSIKSSREFLLEHMREFYKKYKRTPRTSDMRRGLLPYHQIYCKVFGTLNRARQEAGIPVLIKISKYRYEEALI